MAIRALLVKPVAIFMQRNPLSGAVPIGSANRNANLTFAANRCNTRFPFCRKIERTCETHDLTRRRHKYCDIALRRDLSSGVSGDFRQGLFSIHAYHHNPFEFEVSLNCL
jgi:hypothetical protein